ncbi:electron transfer flavoprotein subunit alpha/FixB family protein, partial [bacterium]|nr:electron transfer flavoprotein subunit alpha/FixB family protein [bacterium]
MAAIWVYLETAGQALSKGSLEALGEARRQADASGGSVTGLLFGGPGSATLAAAAGMQGADRVILAEDPACAAFNLELQLQLALRALAGSEAELLLMTVSTHTRELAARLAAQLGVGLAADCVELLRAGDGLAFKRPIYAGKAFETLRVAGKPAIATLRPNNFAALPPP